MPSMFYEIGPTGMQSAERRRGIESGLFSSCFSSSSCSSFSADWPAAFSLFSWETAGHAATLSLLKKSQYLASSPSWRSRKRRPHVLYTSTPAMVWGGPGFEGLGRISRQKPNVSLLGIWVFFPKGGVKITEGRKATYPDRGGNRSCCYCKIRGKDGYQGKDVMGRKVQEAARWGADTRGRKRIGRAWRSSVTKKTSKVQHFLVRTQLLPWSRHLLGSHPEELRRKCCYWSQGKDGPNRLD